MALLSTLRCTRQLEQLGTAAVSGVRHASTKAAESFMAELEASGFTPTDIKKICTKHPSMLSKHWTPAARKQKIELLKKIDEQEKAKTSQEGAQVKPAPWWMLTGLLRCSAFYRANAQALHAAWQTWRNRLAANSCRYGKYVCTEDECVNFVLFCTLWTDLFVIKSLSSQQQTSLPGSPVQLYEWLMKCILTVCPCVHTKMRAWAFEQQQVFALDFNPFPQYQQCAITLQHDCSELLP